MGNVPLHIAAHINHPLSHSRNIWSWAPPFSPGQPPPRPLGPRTRGLGLQREEGQQGAPFPLHRQLVNRGAGSVKIRPVCGPGLPGQIPRPGGASAQDTRGDRGLPGPAGASAVPPPPSARPNPLDFGLSPPQREPGGPSGQRGPGGVTLVSAPPHIQALPWRSWCWETWPPDRTGRKEATLVPGGGQGGRGGGHRASPSAAPAAMALFSQKCG